MPRVTGKAFIKYNGKQLTSRTGSKLMFGNADRQGVVGDTGVHGYTEENQIPEVECTISHRADTSLAELAAIDDATIVFECDTGKGYVLRQAWQSGNLELNASEGTVGVKFQAMSCEEMQ